jgi:signal transduction histidine kinase
LARPTESGVDTTVEVPDVVPLDKSGLKLVHRVCGEALSNVWRHAAATVVAVTVVGDADEVVVTITDDGRGFLAQDVARQRADGHFGTRFLEEKAEVAGGTFRMTSEPGEGTRVELRLPMRERAAVIEARS